MGSNVPQDGGLATDTKPLVKLIGTGGSISLQGSGRLDFTEYGYSGKHLTIEQMLAGIPGVERFARVQVEQFENVGSPAIGPQHWLGLAKRVNRIFREEPEVAGIAITHGTATLEETAYFLNLTVKSDKPVVITGSLRPPTALDSDADPNLLDCILTAASPEACGKGVLVVLNNEVQAAREVTKTNTYRLEAFQTPHFGFLGYADADHQVIFYRMPTRSHTYQTEFDVDGLGALPRVDIAYSYAGADGLVVRALTQAGVDGIVAAGTGSGNGPPDFQQALEEAVTQGISVVQASHTGSGRVVMVRRRRETGLIVADNLTPKKARILLMCALTVTRTRPRIQEMFEAY
jgi:L-asparaginase